MSNLLYDAFEAGWFDNHGSIADAWKERSIEFTMELEHIFVFPPDDPEHVGNPMAEALRLGKDLLLEGDWYNHRINDQIKGFLAGLGYAGVEFMVRERFYEGYDLKSALKGCGCKDKNEDNN